MLGKTFSRIHQEAPCSSSTTVIVFINSLHSLHFGFPTNTTQERIGYQFHQQLEIILIILLAFLLGLGTFFQPVNVSQRCT